MDMLEVADKIGRLADTADNFWEYARPNGAFTTLPINTRLDALKHGLEELRDGLRVIAIECGLDADTWEV